MSEGLPETLEWGNCCDHLSCKRQYPKNLGFFTYGTGFDPQEKDALNRAWDMLNKSTKEKETTT